MYFSLAHSNVGSVNTSFDITKINLETSTQEWTSSGLQMNVVGQPTSSSGSNEAVLSFDIDCNGDIYATGYYGSPNYSPGAWGIMKIDGSNGSKINDITVTNNSAFVDEESVGLKVFLINDTPFFLGNLEDQPNSSTRVFVETDTSLNSILNLVDLCNSLSLEHYSLNENDLKLYPNPTSGMLFIESKEAIKLIQLFDINGRKVYSSIHNTSSIDIASFSSGIYFLKMESENGFTTKKVIVE